MLAFDWQRGQLNLQGNRGIDPFKSIIDLKLLDYWRLSPNMASQLANELVCIKLVGSFNEENSIVINVRANYWTANLEVMFIFTDRHGR